MTETEKVCRNRRAVVWAQDGWWTVSLHHREKFVGNLSWPTWPEALTSALSWVGLVR